MTSKDTDAHIGLYILQGFLLQFHFLRDFISNKPTGYNKSKGRKVKSRAGRTTT